MAGKHTSKSKPRAKKSGKRRAITWASVLVILAGAGTFGYHEMHNPLSAPGNIAHFKNETLITQSNANSTERTTVLFIGTDTRPGQTGGNTDVLILCSIDRKAKLIEMMSIPRDTKIQYPDGSYAKINEAYMLGGQALTENLVSTLIGEPIDNYALTHFGGLVDIINTLHGITIDVPENMYYNTGDKQYNIINLHKGVQTLNGAQALGFVRFRHDALGDIGRTMRQQVFLKALADKLLQPSTIPELPTLTKEFWGTIETDMSFAEVMGLASNAKTYEGYKIIHMTLPGSFHNPDPSIPNDESYWIVNPVEAKYVAKEFFQDGVVYSTFPVQTPDQTANWQPPTTPTGNSTNSAGNSSSNTTGSNSGSGSSSGNSVSGSNSDSSGTSDNSSGTSTAGTTSTNAGNATQMTVSASSAYIRSGPGSQYSVVGSLVNGQSVWVIGQSGQWDEVNVQGGGIGYIASWLLTTAQ